jgi:peptide chain release factor subunit 1
MAGQLTLERLRSLTQVQPEHGLVLSVFLNLDPAENPTPAARATALTSVLTSAAHEVEEAAGLGHDDRMALRGDLDRVRSALQGEDVFDGGARGAAVYACAPAGLLEVVRLREPVRSRAVLERRPFVAPLVREGIAERWMVVLCNRRVARLFAGPGDALEETERLVDEVYSQHQRGGWSQARFQRSVEKEKDDHLAHTAAIAFDAYKRHGADRLLVAAPDELVGEVEHALHPYLRERIAARLRLDIEHASLEEVCAAAKAAIDTWAADCERGFLDRLAEGVGRGDRGVAGMAEVQGALAEARVELLLVSPDLAVDDDPEVETAIEHAIAQAARVVVVRHHPDLGPLGGIGAVLRF